VFDPLLPPAGPERERLVTLLGIALEVRTWAQLRHEADCGKRATRDHLEQLVTALIGR